MTLLGSSSSAVAGPLYAFARVIALLKSVRISFHLKKNFVRCSLSFSVEHKAKIRNKVPNTMPGSRPGVWAVCGGMNRCRLSLFSNRIVSILFELLIEIVMSMKSINLVRSLNSHVRPGNAFILSLNSFHSCASRSGFLFGHHMPMTSPMNLI